MRASRSRRLRPPGLPRWSCSCWLSTGSSRPLPEPPGPARGHFDMILLVKTPLDVACGLRARRYPMARWPGAGWPSAGNLWTTWASRIDSGRLPWCASADQARPRFEDAALSRLLGDGGGCAFKLLGGWSLVDASTARTSSSWAARRRSTPWPNCCAAKSIGWGSKCRPSTCTLRPMVRRFSTWSDGARPGLR